MEPGVAYIGGGLFALANVLAFWVREVVKHRTWAKNGTALKEIKDQFSEANNKTISQLSKTDEKIGQIKEAIVKVQTEMKSQKQQCGRTVGRFDAAIVEQGRELIKLAGRKR